MLRWLWSLPFGAVALVVAHVGCAQDYTPPHLALDKVDRVRLQPILIDDDKVCKVDRDHVKTSIKFILNTANIPFIEQLPTPDINKTLSDAEFGKRLRETYMPTLWIEGGTLAGNTACAYNVKIKVEEMAKPTSLMYTSSYFNGTVELWSEGSFGLGPRGDMTKQLSGVIENALKEFVNLRADDIKQAAQ